MPASTWERAEQLAQVDDMLLALVQKGRKHKPRLDVHRALPVFLVADPEACPPTLVKCSVGFFEGRSAFARSQLR